MAQPPPDRSAIEFRGDLLGRGTPVLPERTSSVVAWPGGGSSSAFSARRNHEERQNTGLLPYLVLRAMRI